MFNTESFRKKLNSLSDKDLTFLKGLYCLPSFFPLIMVLGWCLFGKCKILCLFGTLIVQSVQTLMQDFPFFVNVEIMPVNTMLGSLDTTSFLIFCCLFGCCFYC